MEIIKIILWAFALMAAFIYLKYYFIPIVKNKYMLWNMGRKIKKMAKKYDGETREQLEYIHKVLGEIQKETNL